MYLFLTDKAPIERTDIFSFLLVMAEGTQISLKSHIEKPNYYENVNLPSLTQ